MSVESGNGNPERYFAFGRNLFHDVQRFGTNHCHLVGIGIAAILVMLIAFRRGITSRKLLASMALFYVVFVVWVIVRRLV